MRTSQKEKKKTQDWGRKTKSRSESTKIWSDSSLHGPVKSVHRFGDVVEDFQNRKNCPTRLFLHPLDILQCSDLTGSGHRALHRVPTPRGPPLGSPPPASLYPYPPPPRPCPPPPGGPGGPAQGISLQEFHSTDGEETRLRTREHGRP